MSSSRKALLATLTVAATVGELRARGLRLVTPAPPAAAEAVELLGRTSS